MIPSRGLTPQSASSAVAGLVVVFQARERDAARAHAHQLQKELEGSKLELEALACERDEAWRACKVSTERMERVNAEREAETAARNALQAQVRLANGDGGAGEGDGVDKQPVNRSPRYLVACLAGRLRAHPSPGSCAHHSWCPLACVRPIFQHISPVVLSRH